MKVRGFFVNKECIWHPNQLDVFRSDHKLFKANPSLEGKTRIPPKLTEIHVKGKVLQISRAVDRTNMIEHGSNV